MDTSFEACCSPASSSSSSLIDDDDKYDVFLSFRGEDTRKTFTDHLYWRLKDACIDVFIDDTEGKRIPDHVKQAIEGSRMAVIIFSRRYADSTRCLEEVVKIMECRERLGQMVLPVFYDVDPADVRKQTGTFEEAFQKHDEQFLLFREEKVQPWRNALAEAADLPCLTFRETDGYEGVFIRKIIDEITKNRKSTGLDVDNKQFGTNSCGQEIRKYLGVQVGLHSRVREISKYLGVGGSNDVRIVGIWGVGGIGKTTLTKAIFNKYHHLFDGTCFLHKVREKELDYLQERLLNDILKRTNMIKVSSVAQGAKEIEKRLRRIKVLVIIDDVDNVKQLDALAIKCSSFGMGSRIIVTTREKHLLTELRVDVICFAQAMNNEEALELLSWHAFGNRCPNEGYLELSTEAADYCGGLPLALKVLGSSLYTKSKREWISTLDKLKIQAHGDILEKLKICYDGLTDDAKAIFLPICCFCIGMNKDYILKVLDGHCYFDPAMGVRELQERCLVTVDKEGNLMMHDLIRDMGKEIVRTESPNPPGKRSRLWYHEDVTGVLGDNTGMEEIEGLTLDFQESDELSFSTEEFRNMPKLRLLKLKGVNFTGHCEDFPKKLRLLCLPEFPSTEYLNHRTLDVDLSHTPIQVWMDSDGSLEKLKFLDLSNCNNLKRLPKALDDCKSLSTLHHSIARLKNLRYLSLANCNLTDGAIPEDMGGLSSLEVLDLRGNGFNGLPFLSGFSKLHTLQLENCTNLQAIPDLPKKLEILVADECIALEKMPDFSEMLSMRELHLNHSPKLTEISGLGKSLDSMTRIHMEGCTNLTAAFKESILLGWTSCGYGGIFLNGTYIPEWFKFVSEGARIYFEVPQIVGRGFKGLTLCFVYSSDSRPDCPIRITITNNSKGTTLHTWITYSSVPTSSVHEDDYLWLGQLSNDMLCLQGGDKVNVFVEPVLTAGTSVGVKKTGVNLVWDKILKENTHDSDLFLYDFSPRLDWLSGPDDVAVPGPDGYDWLL